MVCMSPVSVGAVTAARSLTTRVRSDASYPRNPEREDQQSGDEPIEHVPSSAERVAPQVTAAYIA
jgi:hypothetical protein